MKMCMSLREQLIIIDDESNFPILSHFFPRALRVTPLARPTPHRRSCFFRSQVHSRLQHQKAQKSALFSGKQKEEKLF